MSNAHAVRACLFAKARAATFAWVRTLSCVTHIPMAVVGFLKNLIMYREPWIKATDIGVAALADTEQRRSAARRVLSWTRPSQAAKLRPDLNIRPSPIAATIAVAVIAPIRDEMMVSLGT